MAEKELDEKNWPIGAQPMKWFTGKGDGGTSGLIGGRRLTKDHPIFAALGALDEANADLGLARVFCRAKKLAQFIAELQDALFRVGADLATPLEHRETLAPRVTSEDTRAVETAIAHWSRAVPDLTRFVLPGGDKTAAFLYRACTSVRRAEREVVRVTHMGVRDGAVVRVNRELVAYLNRFSKLLFVLFLAQNEKTKQQREHPTYGKPQ